MVDHLDAASGWWPEGLDVLSSCGLLVAGMAAPPATTAGLAGPTLAAAMCLIRLPAIARCCCLTPASMAISLQAIRNSVYATAGRVGWQH